MALRQVEDFHHGHASSVGIRCREVERERRLPRSRRNRPRHFPQIVGELFHRLAPGFVVWNAKDRRRISAYRVRLDSIHSPRCRLTWKSL
jgi:hypothetical protein